MALTVLTVLIYSDPNLLVCFLKTIINQLTSYVCFGYNGFAWIALLNTMKICNCDFQEQNYTVNGFIIRESSNTIQFRCSGSVGFLFINTSARTHLID